MSSNHLFRKQPSEAQKSAGNYSKDHKRVLGMRVTVETPRNQFRSGTDKQGNKWRQQLKHDYGYIRGAYGKDKDHLDVFIGPEDPKEHPVHVVDQYDPDTGDFDEHKVMLGFPHPQAATDAYHQNYEPGWRGFGDITALNHRDFKRWAFAPGKRNKPIAEHSAAGKAIKSNPAPSHAPAPKNAQTAPSEASEVQEFAKGGLVGELDLGDIMGASKPGKPMIGDLSVGGVDVMSYDPNVGAPGGQTTLETQFFDPTRPAPGGETPITPDPSVSAPGATDPATFIAPPPPPPPPPVAPPPVQQPIVAQPQPQQPAPQGGGGGFGGGAPAANDADAPIRAAYQKYLASGSGEHMGFDQYKFFWHNNGNWIGNPEGSYTPLGYAEGGSVNPYNIVDMSALAPGGTWDIAEDPLVENLRPPQQTDDFSMPSHMQPGAPGPVITPTYTPPAPQALPVRPPPGGGGAGGGGGAPIQRPPTARNKELDDYIAYMSALAANNPVDYTGAGAKTGGHITRRRFADGGAAFGRYPSAGKRPERLNDREANANGPLYLGRGALTGILGAPGEAELFARWLANMLSAGVDEESLLPGIDRVSDFLPGKPQRPSERFFQGMGELGGGSASPVVHARRLPRLLPNMRPVPTFSSGGPVMGLYNSDIGQGALQSAVEKQREEAMARAQAAMASQGGGGGRMVQQGPDFGKMAGSMAGSMIGNYLLPGVGGYIGGYLGGYAEDILGGVGDFVEDIFDIF